MVAIVGVGYTAVGEHWKRSLRDIALQAVQTAMSDAALGPNSVDALVIGNALAGVISHQSHLGPMLADYLGLRGIEAYRVEGADASGGLALCQGAALVRSGAARTVVVLGIEKMTDVVGMARGAALTTLLDADFEAVQGATPIAMAGLLMRRYMHVYGVGLEQFEGFSVNAHANGSSNPNAMFRNKLKTGFFTKAPIIADPVNLFDKAPEADGAAAVILTSAERAADMVPRPIRIVSSAIGTDTLALHGRSDILFLRAVNLAAGRAFERAGLSPFDVEVVELHDSFTVLSALQLEAAGFAEAGQGWRFASEGKIGLEGDLPLSTFGGLKARGNPLGATGVYQIGELVLQLQRRAGDNQVIADIRTAMAINVGGLGSTAVVHLLQY